MSVSFDVLVMLTAVVVFYLVITVTVLGVSAYSQPARRDRRPADESGRQNGRGFDLALLGSGLGLTGALMMFLILRERFLLAGICGSLIAGGMTFIVGRRNPSNLPTKQLVARSQSVLLLSTIPVCAGAALFIAGEREVSFVLIVVGTLVTAVALRRTVHLLLSRREPLYRQGKA